MKDKQLKTESKKITIGNIPALVWGGDSDKVYLYVHGKMACKEYAERFAAVAEKHGYQTISFDLPEHGERAENREYKCDIWNGMHDLELVGDYVFGRWENVSLFACSIGAYFSLNAYSDRKFSKCLFKSPIVNMEYLIDQMMTWFGVTEERLRTEKTIPTPVDTMSWEYYEYVKSHPISRWNFDTRILYAGKDNLQSEEVVRKFASDFGCKLLISETSLHPFMEEADYPIVEDWLDNNI